MGQARLETVGSCARQMQSKSEQNGRPAWAAALGNRLQANVPLAPLTTLKIGGPAEWYYRAESVGQIVAAVDAARQASIPIVFLGDGSNVLVSDQGVRGLVIHNQAAGIERRGTALFSEAGARLTDLVQRSRVEELAGLEFAAGIYGTVGGAVFGNAGAYGKSMSHVLTWVEVLTAETKQARLTPDEMDFAYRHSGCGAHGWLVLSCEVGLSHGVGDQIGTEIDRILAMRASKLPVSLPSAGSYFKNVEDSSVEHGKIPAGKMLEAVGAKSLSVGGAGVYEGHANIIVNRGGATAADVLALASEMKRRVLDRFGIELESEVRFIGESPRDVT
jgi:UDP-N-acetylmuramate dehydrogenase